MTTLAIISSSRTLGTPRARTPRRATRHRRPLLVRKVPSMMAVAMAIGGGVGCGRTRDLVPRRHFRTPPLWRVSGRVVLRRPHRAPSPAVEGNSLSPAWRRPFPVISTRPWLPPRLSRATILAGGTDLSERQPPRTAPDQGHRDPTVLELREWVTASSVRVSLQPARGQFDHCARRGGSYRRLTADPQHWNLGGNVATASPRRHPPLPRCRRCCGRVAVGCWRPHFMPWDEFTSPGPSAPTRRPGELIIGVRLPDRLPARQAFAKIGVRNAMVIAIASCCRHPRRRRTHPGCPRLSGTDPDPGPARRGDDLVERHPSDAARTEFARLVSDEN